MVRGEVYTVGAQTGRVSLSRKAARQRGRLMRRLLFILVLAMALVLILPRVVRVMARPAVEPPPVYITVQPGDTLWEIARQYSAGEDIRKVIWEIQRANGLTGAVLQPGMVLVIPGDRPPA